MPRHHAYRRRSKRQPPGMEIPVSISTAPTFRPQVEVLLLLDLTRPLPRSTLLQQRPIHHSQRNHHHHSQESQRLKPCSSTKLSPREAETLMGTRSKGVCPNGHKLMDTTKMSPVLTSSECGGSPVLRTIMERTTQVTWLLRAPIISELLVEADERCGLGTRSSLPTDAPHSQDHNDNNTPSNTPWFSRNSKVEPFHKINLSTFQTSPILKLVKPDKARLLFLHLATLFLCYYSEEIQPVFFHLKAVEDDEILNCPNYWASPIAFLYLLPTKIIESIYNQLYVYS